MERLYGKRLGSEGGTLPEFLFQDGNPAIFPTRNRNLFVTY